jgi:hypothetical protein
MLISGELFGMYFSCGAATQREPWPPHYSGFYMTHSNIPQSAGLLWTSDQLVAETSTSQKYSFPPAEFELTISAVERSQTYALERPATGTCLFDIAYSSPNPTAI